MVKAPLKRRIKNALQETRFLLLGAQVLLAFQARAALLPGYKDLSPLAKQFTLIGLFPALLLLALLLAPLAYHRVAEDGDISERLHRFTSGVLRWGLFVFAVCLGVILFLASDRILSEGVALTVGAAATATGLGCWFGVEALARKRRDGKFKNGHEGDMGHHGQQEEEERPELADRIDEVLSEGSMVVPGNTALLGFGLITMYLESFGELPFPVQLVQMIGVGFITLSTILLMTPPAYHRLVNEGEDSEDFYTLASRLITAALVPFALGINSSLFVVAFKVTGSYAVAVVSTLVMLTLFYGLWFGYTGYKRAAKARKANPRRLQGA